MAGFCIIVGGKINKSYRTILSAQKMNATRAPTTPIDG